MTNVSNLNLSRGTLPPLLKYKIVFLGDQAVGKSSIINRFIYDIFDGHEHVLPAKQRPTIGIDFISQNIFLEDRTIRLQLWDTAGQERFKSLIPNYIRDTAVAVIVYDAASRPSFRSVQKWVDDVRAQLHDSVIIALLANKVDLPNLEVKPAEGEALAHENGILFKKVSAKTGVGIQEFFKEIASLLPDANEPTTRQAEQVKKEPPREMITLRPPQEDFEAKKKTQKKCC